jgi:deazaflavin-dependent oxidoreductase (nitroreductase family)
MTVKDRLFRLSSATHRAVFKLSKGRLLGRIAGMPVVVLTTTGRKSGKKRESIVTSPVHDDDRVVLVASFGGDPRHPAWFLNLRDNPDVGVVMAGQGARRMRAQVATDEEKAELWPAIEAAYANYGEYQRKTDRNIPVVLLTPAV